jgi:uncharacterized protein (UPF0333 family)
MHNKKGQALVEFVIILPFIIYIIIGVIDFACIMYHKNNLESKMEDVITLYHDNASEEDIIKFVNKDEKNVTYKVKDTGDDIIIGLREKYKILTPGLNKILGNPYYIEVERTILK